MLIQSLYNIVDSIFVSSYNADAFTALSLAMPLQMIIISFAVGTGIGTSSLVARRLGARDGEGASRAATQGMVISVVSGIVITVGGLLSIKPFMNAFTDDAVLVNYGLDYLSIVLCFAMFQMIQLSIEKTLQATGNMRDPMIMNLIGAIVNICLDPVFIFGLGFVPEMGVRGAAVATVIGQFCAMSYAIFAEKFRKKEAHLNFKGYRPIASEISQIYAVGFPSIVMQSIGSVLTIIINSILIKFGSAVSIMGAFFRLQSFVFMPVFGLNQGALPIMGFNYGAKNKKRLNSATFYSALYAFIIMTIGFAIFQIFPKYMLMIFSPTPEMLKDGIPALRSLSIIFPLAAWTIMFSTLFQAMGKGLYSLIISLTRQLIIVMPIAIIFSKYYGAAAVWAAFPIAEGFALVMSIGMLIFVHRKYIRPLGE
jgi:putative MATE family efflux protein